MAGVAAPGGGTSTSSSLTLGHATTTIGEEAPPHKERRECHLVYPGSVEASCGFTFPGDGNGGRKGNGTHSHAECEAKGHTLCAACQAMEELGLSGRRR
jgi:hypothetical protein